MVTFGRMLSKRMLAKRQLVLQRSSNGHLAHNPSEARHEALRNARRLPFDSELRLAKWCHVRTG
jgi:hypothetical protein